MTRTKRSAYTLFEVVLVMAVMVIAAGMSYPSLKSMYPPYKLNGAVDSVRAAWAEARNHAIAEGRPYRFSLESGGGHFRVAPDASDYWPSGEGGNDPLGKGTVIVKALPSGVRFGVGDKAPDEPPAETGNAKEEDQPPSNNWITGVVFLPDGSAKQDVTATFRVRGARPATLMLRGLTGTVTTQTRKQ
jgi:type II secretory pathway pseudopilin PulG